MNDAEIIKMLERDLRDTIERAERGERAFKAAQITIAALVSRAEDAERQVENMRGIACAIASNTSKLQRVAAGEKE